MGRKSRTKWEARNARFEAEVAKPPEQGPFQNWFSKMKWPFWRKPPVSTENDPYPYPDHQPGN